MELPQLHPEWKGLMLSRISPPLLTYVAYLSKEFRLISTLTPNEVKDLDHYQAECCGHFPSYRFSSLVEDGFANNIMYAMGDLKNPCLKIDIKMS